MKQEKIKKNVGGKNLSETANFDYTRDALQ